MKNSLFAVMFLLLSGATFYQCQKDGVTPSNDNIAGQNLLTERGMPCPITVVSTVGGSICGSSTGSGFCSTCTGINSGGLANFAPNVPYEFEPSVIIWSVRNTVDIPGTFLVSNSNSVYKFDLDGNECKDFYLSGCDIIEL